MSSHLAAGSSSPTMPAMAPELVATTSTGSRVKFTIKANRPAAAAAAAPVPAAASPPTTKPVVPRAPYAASALETPLRAHILAQAVTINITIGSADQTTGGGRGAEAGPSITTAATAAAAADGKVAAVASVPGAASAASAAPTAGGSMATSSPANQGTRTTMQQPLAYAVAGSIRLTLYSPLLAQVRAYLRSRLQQPQTKTTNAQQPGFCGGGEELKLPFLALSFSRDTTTVTAARVNGIVCDMSAPRASCIPTGAQASQMLHGVRDLRTFHMLTSERLDTYDAEIHLSAASLLIPVEDDAQLLVHVAFTSTFSHKMRAAPPPVYHLGLPSLWCGVLAAPDRAEQIGGIVVVDDVVDNGGSMTLAQHYQMSVTHANCLQLVVAEPVQEQQAKESTEHEAQRQGGGDARSKRAVADGRRMTVAYTAVSPDPLVLVQRATTPVTQLLQDIRLYAEAQTPSTAHFMRVHTRSILRVVHRYLLHGQQERIIEAERDEEGGRGGKRSTVSGDSAKKQRLAAAKQEMHRQQGEEESDGDREETREEATREHQRRKEETEAARTHPLFATPRCIVLAKATSPPVSIFSFGTLIVLNAAEVIHAATVIDPSYRAFRLLAYALCYSFLLRSAHLRAPVTLPLLKRDEWIFSGGALFLTRVYIAHVCGRNEAEFLSLKEESAVRAASLSPARMLPPLRAPGEVAANAAAMHGKRESFASFLVPSSFCPESDSPFYVGTERPLHWNGFVSPRVVQTQSPDCIRAMKAGLVFVRLEHTVGADNLRDILSRGTRTTERLFVDATMMAPDAEERLSLFRAQWVDGTGYPSAIVTAEFNKKTATCDIAVRQLTGYAPGGPISGIRFSDTLGFVVADIAPQQVLHRKRIFSENVMHSVTCHKKLRRARTKRPGQLERGAVAWLFKGMLLTPLMWVTADPERMWFGGITVRQAEVCHAHALRSGVSVQEHVTAANALGDIIAGELNDPAAEDSLAATRAKGFDRKRSRKKGKDGELYGYDDLLRAPEPVVCPSGHLAVAVLIDSLKVRRYYYGVHIAAMRALSRGCTTENVRSLLDTYRVEHYNTRTLLPMPLNFSRFARYFVQKALIVTMSEMRNPSGETPQDIVDFLTLLCRAHDNSGNAYSDDFFLAALARALGNVRLCGGGYEDAVVPQLQRLLSRDVFMPSHGGIITRAVLLAAARLQAFCGQPARASDAAVEHGTGEELTVAGGSLDRAAGDGGARYKEVGAPFPVSFEYYATYSEEARVRISAVRALVLTLPVRGNRGLETLMRIIDCEAGGEVQARMLDVWACEWSSAPCDACLFVHNRFFIDWLWDYVTRGINLRFERHAEAAAVRLYYTVFGYDTPHGEGATDEHRKNAAVAVAAVKRRATSTFVRMDEARLRLQRALVARKLGTAAGADGIGRLLRRMDFARLDATVFDATTAK